MPSTFREEQTLNLLLWRPKLKIEVGADGVYLEPDGPLSLLSRRTVFGDIRSLKLREDVFLNPLELRGAVKFLGFMGGLGIRGVPGRVWIYNYNANRGVELELRDGRRLIIGSRKPEELHEAIQRGMSPNPSGTG